MHKITVLFFFNCNFMGSVLIFQFCMKKLYLQTCINSSVCSLGRQQIAFILQLYLKALCILQFTLESGSKSNNRIFASLKVCFIQKIYSCNISHSLLMPNRWDCVQKAIITLCTHALSHVLQSREGRWDKDIQFSLQRGNWGRGTFVTFQKWYKRWYYHIVFFWVFPEHY